MRIETLLKTKHPVKIKHHQLTKNQILGLVKRIYYLSNAVIALTLAAIIAFIVFVVLVVYSTNYALKNNPYTASALIGLLCFVIFYVIDTILLLRLKRLLTHYDWNIQGLKLGSFKPSILKYATIFWLFQSLFGSFMQLVPKNHHKTNWLIIVILIFVVLLFILLIAIGIILNVVVALILGFRVSGLSRRDLYNLRNI